MKRLFTVLMVVSLLASAQNPVAITGKVAVFGKVQLTHSANITVANSLADRSASNNNLICSGTSCTLTVPSTTNSNSLAIGWSGSMMPTVLSSAGCTWTIQTAAQTGNGATGNITFATCPSTNGAVTSITITLASTKDGNEQVRYLETSPVHYDTGGTAGQSGSPVTSFAGPALTLAGSNELVFQVCNGQGNPSSMNSPYDTNFVLAGSFQGSSYAITSSGAAATCNGGSQYLAMSAIALAS